ncbi:54S ribosomal protein yml6, mitochondrial [Saxophila tyrrhenica]|uniref:Large ribosomal subunit protein uL4m n=1 Tax=Saxophila tyrrhenica TaxID=1690608 RepID=A0AAV9P4H8_9PEZI|nr:54S ribosomal protein yml6, mitochondrial [Saxophila tyrrhenica]
MASKRISAPARQLLNTFTHHRQPTRSLTTEATPSPNTTLSQTYLDAHLSSAPTEPILNDNPSSIIPPPTQPQRQPQKTYTPPPNPFHKPTHITLHAFPTLEPLSLAPYPSTHLLLPLRKDLLHRAVVHEGDAARQGSANTKHRSEVHGSGRKIRPQKGTGSARLGDKKSPMLKGGGVAFGPKPRDFATGLQRRVYDLAWRTALSYRYARGEMIVLDHLPELPGEVSEGSRERWMRDLLLHNRLGAPDGRTLFLTSDKVESLWDALRGRKTYGLRRKKIMDTIGESRHARALTVGEVDVKDLLELGRVVVERGALDEMLKAHESDLTPGERLNAWRRGQRLEVV